MAGKKVLIKEVERDDENVETIVMSSELIEFLVQDPVCGRSDYSDLPGARKGGHTSWRSYAEYPRRSGTSQTLQRRRSDNSRMTEEQHRKLAEARLRRETLNFRKEEKRERVRALQRERRRQQQLLDDLQYQSEEGEGVLSNPGLIISSSPRRGSPGKSPRRDFGRSSQSKRAKVGRNLLETFEVPGEKTSGDSAKAVSDIARSDVDEVVSTTSSTHPTSPAQDAFTVHNISNIDKVIEEVVNASASYSPENIDYSLLENLESPQLSPELSDTGNDEDSDTTVIAENSKKDPVCSTSKDVSDGSLKMSLGKDKSSDDSTWTITSTTSPEIADADSSTPNITRRKTRKTKRVNYSEMLDDDWDMDVYMAVKESKTSGRKIKPVSRVLEQAIVDASLKKTRRKRKVSGDDNKPASSGQGAESVSSSVKDVPGSKKAKRPKDTSPDKSTSVPIANTPIVDTSTTTSSTTSSESCSLTVPSSQATLTNLPYLPPAGPPMFYPGQERFIPPGGMYTVSHQPPTSNLQFQTVALNQLLLSALPGQTVVPNVPFSPQQNLPPNMWQPCLQNFPQNTLYPPGLHPQLNTVGLTLQPLQTPHYITSTSAPVSSAGNMVPLSFSHSPVACTKTQTGVSSASPQSHHPQPGVSTNIVPNTHASSDFLSTYTQKQSISQTLPSATDVSAIPTHAQKPSQSLPPNFLLDPAQSASTANLKEASHIGQSVPKASTKSANIQEKPHDGKPDSSNSTTKHTMQDILGIKKESSDLNSTFQQNSFSQQKPAVPATITINLPSSVNSLQGNQTNAEATSIQHFLSQSSASRPGSTTGHSVQTATSKGNVSSKTQSQLDAEAQLHYLLSAKERACQSAASNKSISHLAAKEKLTDDQHSRDTHNIRTHQNKNTANSQKQTVPHQSSVHNSTPSRADFGHFQIPHSAAPVGKSQRSSDGVPSNQIPPGPRPHASSLKFKQPNRYPSSGPHQGMPMPSMSNMPHNIHPPPAHQKTPPTHQSTTLLQPAHQKPPLERFVNPSLGGQERPTIMNNPVWPRGPVSQNVRPSSMNIPTHPREQPSNQGNSFLVSQLLTTPTTLPQGRKESYRPRILQKNHIRPPHPNNSMRAPLLNSSRPQSQAVQQPSHTLEHPAQKQGSSKYPQGFVPPKNVQPQARSQPNVHGLKPPNSNSPSNLHGTTSIPSKPASTNVTPVSKTTDSDPVSGIDRLVSAAIQEMLANAPKQVHQSNQPRPAHGATGVRANFQQFQIPNSVNNFRNQGPRALTTNISGHSKQQSASGANNANVRGITHQGSEALFHQEMQGSASNHSQANARLGNSSGLPNTRAFDTSTSSSASHSWYRVCTAPQTSITTSEARQTQHARPVASILLSALDLGHELASSPANHPTTANAPQNSSSLRSTNPSHIPNQQRNQLFQTTLSSAPRVAYDYPLSKAQIKQELFDQTWQAEHYRSSFGANKQPAPAGASATSCSVAETRNTSVTSGGGLSSHSSTVPPASQTVSAAITKVNLYTTATVTSGQPVSEKVRIKSEILSSYGVNLPQSSSQSLPSAASNSSMSSTSSSTLLSSSLRPSSSFQPAISSDRTTSSNSAQASSYAKLQQVPASREGVGALHQWHLPPATISGQHSSASKQVQGSSVPASHKPDQGQMNQTPAERIQASKEPAGFKTPPLPDHIRIKQEHFSMDTDDIGTSSQSSEYSSASSQPSCAAKASVAVTSQDRNGTPTKNSSTSLFASLCNNLQASASAVAVSSMSQKTSANLQGISTSCSTKDSHNRSIIETLVTSASFSTAPAPLVQKNIENRCHISGMDVSQSGHSATPQLPHPIRVKMENASMSQKEGQHHNINTCTSSSTNVTTSQCVASSQILNTSCRPEINSVTSQSSTLPGSVSVQNQSVNTSVASADNAQDYSMKTVTSSITGTFDTPTTSVHTETGHIPHGNYTVTSHLPHPIRIKMEHANMANDQRDNLGKSPSMTDSTSVTTKPAASTPSIPVVTGIVSQILMGSNSPGSVSSPAVVTARNTSDADKSTASSVSELPPHIRIKVEKMDSHGEASPSRTQLQPQIPVTQNLGEHAHSEINSVTPKTQSATVLEGHSKMTPLPVQRDSSTDSLGSCPQQMSPKSTVTAPSRSVALASTSQSIQLTVQTSTEPSVVVTASLASSHGSSLVSSVYKNLGSHTDESTAPLQSQVPSSHSQCLSSSQGSIVQTDINSALNLSSSSSTPMITKAVGVKSELASSSSMSLSSSLSYQSSQKIPHSQESTINKVPMQSSVSLSSACINSSLSDAITLSETAISCSIGPLANISETDTLTAIQNVISSASEDRHPSKAVSTISCHTEPEGTGKITNTSTTVQTASEQADTTRPEMNIDQIELNFTTQIPQKSSEKASESAVQIADADVVNSTVESTTAAISTSESMETSSPKSAIVQQAPSEETSMVATSDEDRQNDSKAITVCDTAQSKLAVPQVAVVVPPPTLSVPSGQECRISPSGSYDAEDDPLFAWHTADPRDNFIFEEVMNPLSSGQTNISGNSSSSSGNIRDKGYTVTVSVPCTENTAAVSSSDAEAQLLDVSAIKTEATLSLVGGSQREVMDIIICASDSEDDNPIDLDAPTNAGELSQEPQTVAQVHETSSTGTASESEGNRITSPTPSDYKLGLLKSKRIDSCAVPLTVVVETPNVPSENTDRLRVMVETPNVLSGNSSSLISPSTPKSGTKMSHNIKSPVTGEMVSVNAEQMNYISQRLARVSQDISSITSENPTTSISHGQSTSEGAQGQNTPSKAGSQETAPSGPHRPSENAERSCSSGSAVLEQYKAMSPEERRRARKDLVEIKKEKAEDCVVIDDDDDDNEDAMSTASSGISHSSRTSEKGKQKKPGRRHLERSQSGASSSSAVSRPLVSPSPSSPSSVSSALASFRGQMSPSGSRTSLMSPTHSTNSQTLAAISSWSAEEVSDWLKTHKLDRICPNLNSLDGKGLQRMAFEYQRDPDVFYTRVKKTLGLSLFQTLVICRSMKELTGVSIDDC